MIPYPYCFLGDLDKYAPFLEKTSCVAGTKLLAINSNGDVHACVHEANSYGNIFKKGLKDVWKNMQDWHTGKMFPDNCKVCPFFDECIAGCRIAAKAYFRDMSAEDNLRVGWKNITRPIDLKPTEKMYKIIETEPLEVVQSLRYRKEDNFYYITVFGAKGFIVENEVVDFLKEFKNKTFTLKEVGEDKKDMLALCYFYDLIQSTSRKEADKKKGNLKEFVKKD